jgi:Zn finger protein HypA/HybF involved in hydrogenase expression
MVASNFNEFWQPVNDGLNKLRQTKGYMRLNERQKQKLEYYFVMHCLEIGFYNAAEKIYKSKQLFPDRPNGGKWIAMGFSHPKNSDLKSAEYYKYTWAGERRYCWEGCLGAKEIDFNIYDTPLEKQRYYHTKYNLDDKVYPILKTHTYQWIQCKSCSGTGKIKLNDGEIIYCPKCYGRCGEKEIDKKIWIIDYEHIGKIGNVRTENYSKKYRSEKDEVRYMLDSTGVGSGTVWHEEDLYLTEKEAQVECDKRNNIL